MKQHITREQWLEITPEQAGYLMNEMGLKLPRDPMAAFTDFPTIGQMIEFLNNKRHAYEPWSLRDFDDVFDYLLGDENMPGDEFAGRKPVSVVIGWSGKDELCDALWLMVRRILEKA